MKKIFLDTNFIIDLILREEYKSICKDFLSDGFLKGRSFFISFLSVANFAYIARKLPHEELYKYLKIISESFNIISQNKEQLEKAIILGAPDFEDALQYQCAKQERCECIITRNKKDFGFSEIPILSAEDFLAGNQY